MKYGISKYNTIKYGVYNIEQGGSLVAYKPVTRVKIRSKKDVSIAQTFIIPFAKKVRVNDVIAYTLTINGCYNKIRIKSESNKEYNFAEVVRI